ncbi:MAG: hypothetical protein M5U28_17910 [Sandaracinaceae bacterium]|nr:hypothetical protein [Sandaracinaceae bacterium]
MNDEAALARATPELEALGRCTVERGRTILAVVGQHLAVRKGLGAEVLAAVAEAGVNVEMISYAAGSINFADGDPRRRHRGSRGHAAPSAVRSALTRRRRECDRPSVGSDQPRTIATVRNVTRRPLYGEFTLQASLRTWQIRYCHADHTECERFQRKNRGDPVPLRMLPNGQMLPGAKKDEG